MLFFILLLLRFYTLIKIKIELSIDNPIFIQHVISIHRVEQVACLYLFLLVE